MRGSGRAQKTSIAGFEAISMPCGSEEGTSGGALLDSPYGILPIARGEQRSGDRQRGRSVAAVGSSPDGSRLDDTLFDMQEVPHSSRGEPTEAKYLQTRGG